MRDPIHPEGKQPLTWLERWVPPPTPAPTEDGPPPGLFGFFWYFTRQVVWPFALATFLD